MCIARSRSRIRFGKRAGWVSGERWGYEVRLPADYNGPSGRRTRQALARLQAWNEAKAELQKVSLPEGPGVGNGTVQYLLGLCAENLGDRAGAELAWRTAASSESWLTDDGPPVKELAEAKIAELARRR